jgi:hypothetical protein
MLASAKPKVGHPRAGGATAGSNVFEFRERIHQRASGKAKDAMVSARTRDTGNRAKSFKT